MRAATRGRRWAARRAPAGQLVARRRDGGWRVVGVALAVTNAKAEAEELQARDNMKRKIRGILDPITSVLTSFDDEEDLTNRIDDIFNKLDTDGSGGLGAPPPHATPRCPSPACLPPNPATPLRCPICKMHGLFEGKAREQEGRPKAAPGAGGGLAPAPAAPLETALSNLRLRPPLLPSRRALHSRARRPRAPRRHATRARAATEGGGDAGADYDEFKTHIRQLPGGSKILITRDEWDIVTEKGTTLRPVACAL